MKAQDYYEQLRKKFFDKYFTDYFAAKNKKKLTAYVTGFLPSEILVAMDIFPFYPETYATAACTNNKADELILEAEKRGVSRDLCAFSTCALGSMYTDKGPSGGMPKPDLLIASSYTCGIHVPWWEIMQQYYKVPLFIIDGPVLSADPEPHHIDFFVTQIKAYIAFLKKETGRSLDEDRFFKTLELSNLASEYFDKTLELRKSRPSPISSRQLSKDMFALVTVPGTEETANLYKALYEATLEKHDQGIGVTEKEEFRLIWDNIPIWHDLDLIEYFESKGMVFVYETLFKEYWAKGLDPANPFESMSRKYLTGWTNRRLERKIEIIEQAVKSHNIDGIVVFENKGCRAYSTGQLDVAQSLKEKMGLPNLSLEGNMADPGGHDPIKVRKMVDSFKDVLVSRQKATPPK